MRPGAKPLLVSNAENAIKTPSKITIDAAGCSSFPSSLSTVRQQCVHSAARSMLKKQ